MRLITKVSTTTYLFYYLQIGLEVCIFLHRIFRLKKKTTRAVVTGQKAIRHLPYQVVNQVLAVCALCTCAAPFEPFSLNSKRTCDIVFGYD